MTARSSFLALLFPLLLSMPALAQGVVRIVDDDGGGGVDFTDIQPAVDAASDGDTILVKEGQYGSFTILNKALDVVAEADALAEVRGPEGLITEGDARVEVLGLSAGKTVRLVGLKLRGKLVGELPPIPPTVLIRDCAGFVWLQDCEVNGHSTTWLIDLLEGGGISDSTPACRVENSSAVVITNCTLDGRDFEQDTFYYWYFNSGVTSSPHGLSISNSTVHLHSSVAQAGPIVGGSRDSLLFGECYGPAPRAHGAYVESGTLYAYGSQLIGGEGGDGKDISISFEEFHGGEAGDGGDGLHVEPGPAAVWLRDCVLQGGSAGVDAENASGCIAEVPGVPQSAPPGSVQTLGGRAYSLLVDTPLRVGETGDLTLFADPGELLFLGIAATPGALFLPQFAGSLHLDFFALSAFVGIAPPAGELVLPLTIAPFGTPVDAASLHLQSVVFTLGGQIVLGAPGSLTLLDGGV